MLHYIHHVLGYSASIVELHLTDETLPSSFVSTHILIQIMYQIFMYLLRNYLAYPFPCCHTSKKLNIHVLITDSMC